VDYIKLAKPVLVHRTNSTPSNSDQKHEITYVLLRSKYFVI